MKKKPEEYRTQAEKVDDARKFLARYGYDVKNLTDEKVVEVIKKIQESREEAVQVLSRGRVVDAIDKVLERFVPEGFVGELKSDNDMDISRAQALGWKVCFDEQSKKGATPTGVADGRIRIGDQILMIIPVEIFIGNKLAKEDRHGERRIARDPKKRARDETHGRGDEIAPVFDLSELGPNTVSEE